MRGGNEGVGWRIQGNIQFEGDSIGPTAVRDKHILRTVYSPVLSDPCQKECI